ncbi:MAG: copper chaperone Copz family protein [Bdellovibrio sp.]
MSCCNPKLTEGKKPHLSTVFLCPMCGTKGVKIEVVTIENHLLDKFKKQINNADIYKFCKNPICTVVYFSYQNAIFYKDNLKEKTTLKDDNLDVKTCYCFNITKGNIVDELKRTGDCKVIEVIQSKMKNLGCFCETSNPQGSCCLANNESFIEEAKNRIQQGEFYE